MKPKMGGMFATTSLDEHIASQQEMRSDCVYYERCLQGEEEKDRREVVKLIKKGEKERAKQLCKKIHMCKKLKDHWHTKQAHHDNIIYQLKVVQHMQDFSKQMEETTKVMKRIQSTTALKSSLASQVDFEKISDDLIIQTKGWEDTIELMMPAMDDQDDRASDTILLQICEENSLTPPIDENGYLPLPPQIKESKPPKQINNNNNNSSSSSFGDLDYILHGE